MKKSKKKNEQYLKLTANPEIEERLTDKKRKMKEKKLRN